MKIEIIDLGNGIELEQIKIGDFIYCETQLKNGKRNGYVKLFRPNGMLRCESHFKNDLRDGWTIWYNDNGDKETALEYDNGNLISGE